MPRNVPMSPNIDFARIYDSHLVRLILAKEEINFYLVMDSLFVYISWGKTFSHNSCYIYFLAFDVFIHLRAFVIDYAAAVALVIDAVCHQLHCFVYPWSSSVCNTLALTIDSDSSIHLSLSFFICFLFIYILCAYHCYYIICLPLELLLLNCYYRISPLID